jgi:hypothetical protein
MVDFGSEQGLSNFETAGITGYFEDFKRAKTPLWAKRCRLWMGTNYQNPASASITIEKFYNSNYIYKLHIIPEKG